MWNGSHETWVDCLKRHLKAWKLRTSLSDQAICDEIVKAHERIGGPEKTGIVFAPGSKDEYNRQKANCAKIMRMLTDEPHSDFEAVQLVNMLPSITAAMPADLCISFWTEYLAPVGLAPQGMDGDADVGFSITQFSQLLKADSEAHQACAEVIANPDIETLVKARKTLRMAVIEKLRKSRAIEAMIRAKAALGTFVNRRKHDVSQVTERRSADKVTS